MSRALWLVLACAACQHGVTFPADEGRLPESPVLPFSTQDRFAITNNRSDTMSFVSAGATLQLLGEVPIGDNPVELEGPHHLAASPDGNFIYYNLSNYVPGAGSGPHGAHGTGNVPGSLVKLDARTMARVGEVVVDESPGDVILSSDGRLAYVTHYDLLRLSSTLSKGGTEAQAYSGLTIVDTETMTRLSSLPACVTSHGEGLSADGRTLYVTCSETDSIAVIDVSDPRAPTVLLRLPLGPDATSFGGAPSYFPYALRVSPLDGTVWVSDNNSGDVRVFDPNKMAMDGTRTIDLGGVAMFSAFTSDGKTLYVPHQGDDRVSAVDTASGLKRDLALPTATCLNAHAITLAPDEKSAVVVCEGDHLQTPGTVVGLDLTSFSVSGFVSVGIFPDGAAWLPAL